MKWVENDNIFRPLQMSHRLVSDRNQPLSEALEQVEKKLKHIKDIGCGGLVTNVCFTDYLESEHFWKIFQETIRICKELGLIVWLYDEKGYPSGGAGGLTLKGHPEYEAYGVVCLEYPVHNTTHIAVELPYGHEKVLSVYACEGESFDPENAIDLSDCVDESGRLVWNSTINGTVYYIATKVLFEGVHAARNWHHVRRYVDVLDADALKRFIDITYGQYYKYVGEYFGNTIEAVFTDEPSVMGGYLRIPNYPLREPNLEDPDENIPLYPFIVWSRKFAEVFKKKKGYDIIPNIPFIFKDDENEKTRKVKQDYYSVMVDMYEEAYFKAIGDFCSEHNIKFTGHLLAEEMLITQVRNEGNFFALMRHMDYTGIDMLSGDPANVRNCPLIPKIASSVAHQYNMPYVMSESSDTVGNTKDKETPPERMLASFATQYALGVNRITSYFADDKFDNKTYKRTYDAVSRMGQLLNGGTHIAPIAVYYPCKTEWQFTTPSDMIDIYRDYTRYFWHCGESFRDSLSKFTSNHIDYDLVDGEGLEMATVSENKMINKYGETYKMLYISAIEFEAEDITERLISMAKSGLKIFIEKSPMHSFDNKSFDKLSKTENISFVESAADLIDYIYGNDLNDIVVKGNNAESVIYLHKNIDGNDRYMFVNTSDKKCSLEIDFKRSDKIVVWDILDDKEISINRKDGIVSFELSAYQVVFAIFE